MKKSKYFFKTSKKEYIDLLLSSNKIHWIICLVFWGGIIYSSFLLISKEKIPIFSGALTALSLGVWTLISYKRNFFNDSIEDNFNSLHFRLKEAESKNLTEDGFLRFGKEFSSSITIRESPGLADFDIIIHTYGINSSYSIQDVLTKKPHLRRDISYGYQNYKIALKILKELGDPNKKISAFNFNSKEGIIARIQYHLMKVFEGHLMIANIIFLEKWVIIGFFSSTIITIFGLYLL